MDPGAPRAQAGTRHTRHTLHTPHAGTRHPRSIRLTRSYPIYAHPPSAQRPTLCRQTVLTSGCRQSVVTSGMPASRRGKRDAGKPSRQARRHLNAGLHGTARTPPPLRTYTTAD
eukprot:298442-Chlamydomonas_euryale.AAC.2